MSLPKLKIVKNRALCSIVVLAISVGFDVDVATAADSQDQGPVAAPAHSATVGPTSGLSADTSFELATGVDYSVGKYGATSDTSVVGIPLDLKVQLGSLRLQASLPYDWVKGPGLLVGGVAVTNPNAPTTSRSGIGDLNLAAAYLLNHEKGALPAIELGVGVKAPTAKLGIGTTKADFSVTGSAYKTIAPGFMLFGSVGYSWLGSLPNYQLKNGVTASGGVNYKPTPNQNIGVSLGYRQPVSAGVEPQVVVSPYLTYRIRKQWGVTLYGLAGLTSASPRVGGGLRLSLFR